MSSNPKRSQRLVAQPLRHASRIINQICALAGSATLLDDVKTDLARDGITRAVADRDTAVLYDWLLRTLSYQGISDRVARAYIARHGSASWNEVAKGAAGASCSLLDSYWHFDGCRYDKGRSTCSHREHIGQCPLPVHKLRNGRLNQTAYSLHLFVRDIAAGDLVTWIEQQIQTSAEPLADRREALIGPLRHIFGISDKVATMAMSSLLIAGSEHYPHWLPIGSGMIVIDTLVHNLFVRSGILDGFNARHAYGPACYAAGGCASILEAVSSQIDARRFGETYPADFPRFIQHALWRYCALDELGICNGNVIDDGKSCQNNYCSIYSICSRIQLNSVSNL